MWWTTKNDDVFHLCQSASKISAPFSFWSNLLLLDGYNFLIFFELSFFFILTPRSGSSLLIFFKFTNAFGLNYLVGEVNIEPRRTTLMEN
ncbi:unnamed protein product [Caenorhabditis brenneri]